MSTHSTNFNDGFKIPFRNYILEDNEVSSLIENRFIGAFLATFYTTNTSFPLATFYQRQGDFPIQNIIQRFEIIVTAYSNLHYDEAYQVYKPIFEKLGGENGPVSINHKITIRPNCTAYETFDDEARLYGVSGRFKVIWFP